MPIETVYRRTAQLDWTEVITCPHCGVKWKGGVIARGHGRDETTYGFGAESAFENAGSDAFARAVDAGRAMLLRARCPHCHKRGGGVGSLVIKTVLFYGFMVALFTWVERSLADGGAGDGASSPGLLPILIALALVLIPITVAGNLRSVDRRVRFEPLQEPGSQPAPPPARPRRGPASASIGSMNAAAPVPGRAPAATPVPAQAAGPAPVPARRSATDSGSLELDTERSWNKKGHKD